jgi:hypothetical protein
MVRFVAAASFSIEVKGICAALTDIPRDSKSEMTFVQLEPSAQAPCTSTTVGGTLRITDSFFAAREDEVPEDCDQVTAHRLAGAQGPRRAARERGVTISGTTAGLR